MVAGPLSRQTQQVNQNGTSVISGISHAKILESAPSKRFYAQSAKLRRRARGFNPAHEALVSLKRS
jgi:hypothetical protein